MKITSLADYEGYLDFLDRKLFVSEGFIHVQFEHPLTISLTACQDILSLKQWAATVRDALRQNLEPLNTTYLIKRFLDLAIKGNSLPFKSDVVMLELVRDWNLPDVYHV